MGAGSRAAFGESWLVEAAEVAVEGVGDPLMSGSFTGPAALFGVVAECPDVVELGVQDWGELWGGDEVVAGFAHVGVGACSGGEMARAVATGKAGLEEFR